MKTLLAVVILTLLTACSRGGNTQQSPVIAGNPATPGGASTPGQAPFDKSGLFDKIGSDPKPTVSPQPIPYKESDVFCLSRDSGLLQRGAGVRGGFASEVNPQSLGTEPSNGGVGTAALGCLSPGSAPFDQAFFLDEALFSMGSMRSAFEYVANQRPAANATALELQAHFSGAKRALVRTYRRILARQSRIAQWSNDSMGRYDQVDSHLFLLLTLLSQQ